MEILADSGKESQVAGKTVRGTHPTTYPYPWPRATGPMHSDHVTVTCSKRIDKK